MLILFGRTVCSRYKASNLATILHSILSNEIGLNCFKLYGASLLKNKDINMRYVCVIVISVYIYPSFKHSVTIIPSLG